MTCAMSMLILLLIPFVTECFASLYCNHKHHRCDTNYSSEVTMIESDDGVKGRYILKLCGALPKPSEGTAEWLMKLYADGRSHDACRDYDSSNDHGVIHSEINEQITISTHCGIECYSTQLDLIYSGCYIIKSKFKYGKEGDCVLKSYVNSTWIQNEINGYKYFNDSKLVCVTESDGNDTIAKWFSKKIPITSYRLTLEKREEKCPTGEVVHIDPECDQTSPEELDCRIKNLETGNYTIILQHTAPWTLGKMFLENNKNQVAQDFSHNLSLITGAPFPNGEPSTSGNIKLWASLVGVAAILILVALVCACRPTRAAVLSTWRERYKNLHVDDLSKKSREECRAVLLLYARDCPPFMDAMRHLRACLQNCCSDKVFDLYDPMTQAEIAPSATEWIHGLLQREDVRVVFVETPVAAEIYSATLLDGEEGLSLQTPLLGSRVLYRAPHPADAQLHYAVRLVKHNAHTQLAYLKYYVASVNVAVEVLPNVAPYRRYPLPGGAQLLLEHVGGAPLSPRAPIQLFDEALHRYTRHVADHPDYVRDLLLLT